jgi:thymidylate synthase (FAD)
MRVKLLAYTMIDEAALDSLDYVMHDEPVTWADELAEFAGRSCYLSWNRPNPKTASNQGYLGHIIDVGHFSVLEHASATFYIEDVPRSFTHEAVRHRHMSFSQVSQRYVDESEANLVLPPNGDDEEAALLRSHHTASLGVYKRLVDHRLALGQTRKQAREAGRAALPNATETKIVITGNMRGWREMIQKRNVDGADALYQQVAAELLRYLKGLAPNTFQDL